MNKSKIEWTTYTINPVKGLCPMACPYCYARAMYKRFKWNPEIRYQFTFDDINIPKPSRIFVGSTMELFGDWIKPEWMQSIFKTVTELKKHTFIFLTKQPQNLIKWSPFPDNCWVGVSATNQEQYVKAFWKLNNIEARVKFISFEPLLEEIKLTPMFAKCVYNWVIIGQQTPVKQSTMPKIEWIQEIVEACDKASIPVFLKNNLLPMLPDLSTDCWMQNADGDMVIRQEFPLEK